MSVTAHEWASQPECWRRAIRMAGETVGALPPRGERVGVVGCGTSFYVALAFAALREGLGHGETDAFAASEFPAARRYDRVLAISRSGTTTEVLQLLERLDGLTLRVVISADADSPAGRLGDASISLAFADERSIVQTRFATSTLAMLRAHLGEDLDEVISQAERTIEHPAPLETTRVEHFVFLGHGWSVGIAEEGALKMREAALVHAEAYPAMEYRHGPISLAGPGSLVWILGSPDPTLAEEIRSTRAAVRIGSADPMAELVTIQDMAIGLAEARGLDPDHPRHLTRSVVLDSRPADPQGVAARTYVKTGEEGP
jgi:fructoselysine-6-P-deglycase FrlB-like protein